jgi:hypothetical protein
MEPFAGFEPQIGEIRAVRSFRIGPGGVLYPLFSDDGWSAGVNTARCSIASEPTLLPGRADHDPPGPTCTCGYYAYASEAGASEYPNARHVLAVVSCWGRVIAGTRGLRTQHARIVAVWMSATVPTDLVAAVANRYEGACIYSDKQLMFGEHPPTVLDCYEPDSPHQKAGRRGERVAVVAALILGVLPHTWLTSNRDLQLAWWFELTLVLASTAVSYRRSGVIAKRRVIYSSALTLWLLAPFGGAAGTLLLRLPMIQLAALVRAQRRVLARKASRFPARIASLDS